MLKAGNHRFAIYHLHYKKKLGIIKSIYNPYFFYRSDLLEIMKIKTNNILIADNIFVSNKKEVIKIIKIMTKDYKYFTHI